MTKWHHAVTNVESDDPRSVRDMITRCLDEAGIPWGGTVTVRQDIVDAQSGRFRDSWEVVFKNHYEPEHEVQRRKRLGKGPEA